MSKKKRKIKPSKDAGLKNFLASPQFAVVRGAFYMLLAFFAVIAVTSFVIKLFFPGENPDFNWLGSFGRWLGELLVSNSFGIASMGLCFLLFVYGLRLIVKNRSEKPEEAPRPTLWGDDRRFHKCLWSVLFWVIWLCTFIGWIANPEKSEQSTLGASLAGVVGTEIARMLHGFLHIGLPILLFFLAMLFLIMVHKVHVPVPNIKLKDGLFNKNRIPEIVNASEEKRSKKNDEEDDGEGDEEEKDGKKGFFAGIFSRFKNNDGEVEDEEDDEVGDDGVDFEDDSHINDLVSESLGRRGKNKNEIKNEIKNENEGNDNTITFSIDDQFEAVNRRAGRPGVVDSGEQEGPIFTVKQTPDDKPLNAAGQDEEPTEEELDTDDYRVHYGVGEPYDPKLDLKDFVMPNTDILEDWEQKNVKVTKEELIANKDRIVETLRDYGIEVTEISAQPGPTVTLYKIKPARGVRISKIQGLENDIALSLAALGIRIIAPIPGESNIGIEVPNAKPQIVAMKTMLESDEFRNAKMELPVAFGKTISNECFVTDLAKMPHLLMAGATGTGKSVGLNAVLASLLYTKHPSELKLVLIDPKKVEFSLYSKIERHYLAVMPDELTKDPDKREPVITDVKKVVRTLNSLCIEMDTRYDLLKAAKVRKITEYNDKFCKRMLNPDHGHRYLPYIVVVIDEFGDLIMTVGKEVELPICRLAQLARAVGIHLIIATQRPTTNIITGTIKANFPARVAFRVTSGIDSKTILDTGGAQQLIGRGDMLISLAGKDLVRLQCALIDTPEIEKLVNEIGEQRGYAEGEGFVLPEYLDENDAPNKEFDAKAKDEFFNDAARLVVASQFGSTSLLQRKLQLGYNRAGRIIDQLEAAGIVGPYNGSKARDVLIKDEVTLEELLRTL